MSAGPQARLLPDGRRLHLQHGPIDLVVEAVGAGTPDFSGADRVRPLAGPMTGSGASRSTRDGGACFATQAAPAPQHDEVGEEVAAAYRAAVARFETILPELCEELPLLRRPVGLPPSRLRGRVARRMFEAVRPYAAEGFITPMAAVAGAVAQEVLEAMVEAAPLRRASVNNGGDIALHLAPGDNVRVGLVDRPDRLSLFGAAEIRASDPVRGLATSGWRGRSFSLGIADAVTILARTAAEADAAATVVANAVDLPGHPAVFRAPARSVQEDSDLGERLVTRAVAPLPPPEIEAALAAGLAKAEDLMRRRLIEAAALHVQGVTKVAGVALAFPSPLREGRTRPEAEPGGGGDGWNECGSFCTTPTPVLRFASARPSPQGGGQGAHT